MLVRHSHSWHKKWSIINYKLTTQGFPGKDIHPSFSQAQQDEMYSINFSSKHNDKQDHKSPDPLPKRYNDQLKLLLLGDFICVQITKCIVRSSQFYLPEQWWQQKGLAWWSTPLVKPLDDQLQLVCICKHGVQSWNISQKIYTVFKVDGPALFQSARIDGADFLNFDTPRGHDIHPPYFCGPRHLCQNVLPMCFRVAPSMQGFLSPKFPSLRNIHPVGCARFFLFPFSFSFPFALSFSPVPFPFSFPFLRSLSSSLFSFFPFSFLLTLSPSPFFLRDKYAIGWHCPRWLRHLFSSLVVKKSFPRKTFVEHTSPLLFQRFDDRNVRSRKKEFKLKMG